jgi:predicted dehydrogenase
MHVIRGFRSNRKVKCGVIGAGWWASYAHLPALLAHPAAEVVALQKRDYDQARAMADDFGVPHAVTDPLELLDLPGLDAVVVSSTPNVHFAQAKAALEAGKHVLIEKPMTMLADEAAELVALAADRRLEMVVSCPWHFTAHGIEARRCISAGEIGRVKMISVLMTNPIGRLLQGIDTIPTHGGNYYIEPRPGSYSDPSIAGGGQIFCQMSHIAAYLCFLTDQLPAEVFARFDYDGCPNDLYDLVNIRLSDGALASVATTAVTPDADRRFEVRVYGTEGMFALELWRGTAEFVKMDGAVIRLPDLEAREIYPERAPAISLIDAILGNAVNGSPGELGLAAMQIIQAACESAQSGKNIRSISRKPLAREFVS